MFQLFFQKCKNNLKLSNFREVRTFVIGNLKKPKKARENLFVLFKGSGWAGGTRQGLVVVRT